MDFFPDLNFLDYLIFVKEVLNRYLEYLYSASIVISFLTGLSGFYKATKNRLNFVRGIFLMSACFLIIGHSKAFSLMTSDPNGILSLEKRVFFPITTDLQFVPLYLPPSTSCIFLVL